MKRTINPILAFSILIVISLTGCLKGNDVNLPATSGDNFIQLDYILSGGTTINSGLNYFSGGALTYPGTDAVDTANYSVYLGGTNTLNKDVPVTISIDANATKDNYSNDSISYLAMPDSLFKLVSTTGTIKSGERVANFKVVFYPSKFNVTKSYILPIKVTNTAGVTISSNYGHIYFHAIGNPIAGSYTQEWIRYNTATITGTPAYDTYSSVIFAPVNPTEISIASGTGVTYIVDFTNTNGVLSNFKVSFPTTGTGSAADNGITIASGPTIVVADPVNHKYEFNFVYNNSAGSPRNITDKFK